MLFAKITKVLVTIFIMPKVVVCRRYDSTVLIPATTVVWLVVVVAPITVKVAHCRTDLSRTRRRDLSKCGPFLLKRDINVAVIGFEVVLVCSRFVCAPRLLHVKKQ